MIPILISFFLPTLTMAALPVDAQKLLDETPEKKLTLQLVLKKAMKSSDSFKSLLAQRLTFGVPRLLAEAPLDARVYSGLSYFDDKRETASPLSPYRTLAKTANLGVSQMFSTGTTAQIELSHGAQEIGFRTFPSLDYRETKGSIGVSQNLLQDAFGFSTREGIEAANLQSDSQKESFRDQAESWALSIVELYYQAWGAQERLRAMQESVSKKKRLVDTTRLKLKRGTSEEPDLIQVQSGLMQAQAEEARAEATLREKWRALVVGLGFPLEWLSIDPLDIPLLLDEPRPESERACQKFEKGSQTENRQESANVLKFQKIQESSQKMVSKFENSARPDLEFRANLSTNGISQEASESFSEMARAEHPAWTLGLFFSMPLDFSAEKAQVLQAKADEIRADAAANLARSQDSLEKIHLCSELNRTLKLDRDLSLVHREQSRRLELEEARFRIGRSQTIQVVQAGDDSVQAKVQSVGAQLESRMVAWKIKRLTRALSQNLEELRPEESQR